MPGQTVEDFLNEEENGGGNQNPHNANNDLDPDLVVGDTNSKDAEANVLARAMAKLLGKDLGGADDKEDEDLILDRQLNAVLDDDIENIDDLDGNSKKEKDSIDRLADVLLAQEENKQKQDQPSQFDTWVDETYGDGIKLEKLFEDGASSEEILSEINDGIKTQMASFAKAIIAQTLNLSKEMNQGLIDTSLKDFQTNAAISSGIRRMHSELEFTEKPANKTSSENLFKLAMKKTNNNEELSLRIVRRAYKKTNPALFDNFEERGFRSSSSRNKGTNEGESFNLTVDNVADFLTG